MILVFKLALRCGGASQTAPLLTATNYGLRDIECIYGVASVPTTGFAQPYNRVTPKLQHTSIRTRPPSIDLNKLQCVENYS